MSKTLTPNELSEYMRISTATVYTMVRESEIPFFRMRSRIFFDKEIIDEWIKSQQLNVLEKQQRHE